MITTHEWTGTERIRRSIEMFARYVMPHFRGHSATLWDEWHKLRADFDPGVESTAAE